MFHFWNKLEEKTMTLCPNTGLFGTRISWEHTMENPFRQAWDCANVGDIFVKNCVLLFEDEENVFAFCLDPKYASHWASWTRRQCVYFTQREQWESDSIFPSWVLHFAGTDTKQLGCTTCLLQLISAKAWLSQTFLVAEISYQYISFWGKMYAGSENTTF